MNDHTQRITDSANALARMAVLVISVVGFATMWESDSHSLDLSVAESQRSDSRDASTSSPDTLPNNKSRLSHEVQTIPIRFGPESSTVFPIPDGISHGRFRVVNSDGLVAMLHLPASMATGRGSEQPLDLYVARDGNITWYFIRVGQANEQVASASTITR